MNRTIRTLFHTFAMLAVAGHYAMTAAPVMASDRNDAYLAGLSGNAGEGVRMLQSLRDRHEAKLLEALVRHRSAQHPEVRRLTLALLEVEANLFAIDAPGGILPTLERPDLQSLAGAVLIRKLGISIDPSAHLARENFSGEAGGE